MATINNLGDNATEIRIDRLNAVLFVAGKPVAATVAGQRYETVNYQPGKVIAVKNQWLSVAKCKMNTATRPQSFFDNILKIYMNPAIHDTPEEEAEHEN